MNHPDSPARRRLAPALLALSTAMLATAATAQEPRSGTLKEVQGEVTLLRGDVARAAVSGAGVSEGERIVTGQGGAAGLTLRDGTVLTVGPHTQLALERFQYDSTTQAGSVWVRLAQGTVRMITGLVAKVAPEQVKVITPTSVVGVRGTDFIVEARP